MHTQSQEESKLGNITDLRTSVLTFAVSTQMLSLTRTTPSSFTQTCTPRWPTGCDVITFSNV